MIYRIILGLLVLSFVPSALLAQTVKPGSEEKDTIEERLKALEQEETDSEEEAKLIPRSLEGPIDPDTYLLGPADVLLLIIGGPENTSYTLRVLPEGKVVLPNAGPFQAAGLTLSEFRNRLRKTLRHFYKNVDIDCQLYRSRAYVVFVLGEVEEPGPVELYAPFRLSRALDGAGGVTSRGSIREIQIRKDGRVQRKVDLFSFMRLGDFDENPTLEEGQSLLVPLRQRSVKVLGEVQKPGTYELLPGETAEDFLDYCGGLTAFGDGQRMVIERVYSRDSTSTITFSLDEAGEIVLENRDVVVIPDIFSFPQSRYIQVVGGGGREGRFFIQHGETLRDFLPRVWRFSGDQIINEAVLERKIDDDKVDHIKFNLFKVFEGDTLGGMELQTGDIINLPPFIKSVFVAGEVTNPGEYLFRADFRANEYISLAGGPTKSGSFNRMVIYSQNGSKRKADGESMVHRGETILVKRNRAAMLGSFIISAGSLSGLVLAIIALTK